MAMPPNRKGRAFQLSPANTAFFLGLQQLSILHPSGKTLKCNEFKALRVTGNPFPATTETGAAKTKKYFRRLLWKLRKMGIIGNGVTTHGRTDKS
jgi:hypothetical protein